MVRQQERVSDALEALEEKRSSGTKREYARAAIKAAGKDMVRSFRQGRLITMEALERREHRAWKVFKAREKEMVDRSKAIVESLALPQEVEQELYEANQKRLQRTADRLSQYEGIMRRVEPRTERTAKSLEDAEQERKKAEDLRAELRARHETKVRDEQSLLQSLSRKGIDTEPPRLSLDLKSGPGILGGAKEVVRSNN